MSGAGIQLERQPGSAQGPAAAADRKLAELEAAHAKLLARITELDRIMQQATVDKYEFTNARFRLSQASLSKRLLVTGICDYLLPLVPEPNAQALRSLVQKQFEFLRHSAAHLSRWTPVAIERNWIDYCEASKEIRRRMESAVTTERTVLCPMLKRYRTG